MGLGRHSADLTVPLLIGEGHRQVHKPDKDARPSQRSAHLGKANQTLDGRFPDLDSGT